MVGGNDGQLEQIPTLHTLPDSNSLSIEIFLNFKTTLIQVIPPSCSSRKQKILSAKLGLSCNREQFDLYTEKEEENPPERTVSAMDVIMVGIANSALGSGSRSSDPLPFISPLIALSYSWVQVDSK
jgi:hypothetical protein